MGTEIDTLGVIHDITSEAANSIVDREFLILRRAGGFEGDLARERLGGDVVRCRSISKSMVRSWKTIRMRSIGASVADELLMLQQSMRGKRRRFPNGNSD